MSNKSFPFKVKDLEPEEAEKMKSFTSELSGFVRVGSEGYVLPLKYKEIAADIYNMEIRPSDTFIVTFPRSGTTWTQELIWMVANNLDYDTAKSVLLTERFPFLEFSMMVNNKQLEKFLERSNGNEIYLKEVKMICSHIVDKVEATPSPRFIKTHLPFTLLPPNLLDAKVVYVARDPRDAAVSFYHLCSSMTFMGWNGDFKTYWNLFIKDLCYYVPFFGILKEAWERRHHPNLLFIFYEELQKDLPAVINRVCDFFGKKYSDEEIARLCEHLNVTNFKKNPAINNDQFKTLGLMHADEDFIRKGNSGGWRDYFDEEMTEQAEQWMKENLRDTDLRFPSME